MQFTVFPQNITVNETNPVVLSCDASGFPEPSLTWTKDGQVVSQSEQLNIQRSDRSDTGIYVCTATNGVGQDMTAQAYVTVQCKFVSHHVIKLYLVLQHLSYQRKQLRNYSFVERLIRLYSPMMYRFV